MATKIKVKRNIWGNWLCFIGVEKIKVYGVEFDAREWLSQALSSGKYILSSKSDITQADIEAHNKSK